MLVRRDWRRLIWRAWSVRLWLIAILLEAVNAGLPWLRDWLSISDGAFGLVTIGFGLAGTIARVVPQQGITPDEAKP